MDLTPVPEDVPPVAVVSMKGVCPQLHQIKRRGPSCWPSSIELDACRTVRISRVLVYACRPVASVSFVTAYYVLRLARPLGRRRCEVGIPHCRNLTSCLRVSCSNRYHKKSTPHEIEGGSRDHPSVLLLYGQTQVPPKVIGLAGGLIFLAGERSNRFGSFFVFVPVLYSCESTV